MYIYGHSISTKTDSPCPLTHYLPNLHYSPTSAHLTSLANYWIVGMSHWLPLAEFASSISATTRDQVWALATLSLPLINRFLLRCLLVLNHWPNWSLTWLINHVLLPPLITLDLAYLHLDTKTHSPRDNQNHLSLMYKYTQKHLAISLPSPISSHPYKHKHKFYLVHLPILYYMLVVYGKVVLWDKNQGVVYRLETF